MDLEKLCNCWRGGNGAEEEEARTVNGIDATDYPFARSPHRGVRTSNFVISL